MKKIGLSLLVGFFFSLLSAQAITLTEARTHSYINEPLKIVAKIVGEGEIVPAKYTDYLRYGYEVIDYNLRYDFTTSNEGERLITISTDTPINDPAFILLLRGVDEAKKATLLEIPIILDVRRPIISEAKDEGTTQADNIQADARSSTDTLGTKDSKTTAQSTKETIILKDITLENYTGQYESYGPIKSGENLWNIAKSFVGGDAESIQAFSEIIKEANPKGFYKDTLLKDVTLQIPTDFELLKIIPEIKKEEEAELIIEEDKEADSQEEVGEDPVTSEEMLDDEAAIVDGEASHGDEAIISEVSDEEAQESTEALDSSIEIIDEKDSEETITSEDTLADMEDEDTSSEERLTTIVKTEERTLFKQYGPVKEGETLWSIASRYASQHRLSTNRLIEDIKKANPRAFPHDVLISGVVLQIPVGTILEEVMVEIPAEEEALGEDILEEYAPQDKEIQDEEIQEEAILEETPKDEETLDEIVEDEALETAAEDEAREEEVRAEEALEEDFDEEAIEEETPEVEVQEDVTQEDVALEDVSLEGEALKDATLEDEILEESVREETEKLEDVLKDERLEEVIAADALDEAEIDESQKEEKLEEKNLNEEILESEVLIEESSEDETKAEELKEDPEEILQADEEAKDKTVTPVVKTAPPASPPEQRSLLDQAMDYSQEILGGVGALLLLLLLLLLRKRGKKTKGPEETPPPPTDSSFPHDREIEKETEGEEAGTTEKPLAEEKEQVAEEAEEVEPLVKPLDEPSQETLEVEQPSTLEVETSTELPADSLEPVPPVSDEPMSDESIGDELIGDEFIEDGPMEDESIRDNLMQDELTQDKPVSDEPQLEESPVPTAPLTEIAPEDEASKEENLISSPLEQTASTAEAGGGLDFELPTEESEVHEPEVHEPEELFTDKLMADLPSSQAKSSGEGLDFTLTDSHDPHDDVSLSLDEEPSATLSEADEKVSQLEESSSLEFELPVLEAETPVIKDSRGEDFGVSQTTSEVVTQNLASPIGAPDSSLNLEEPLEASQEAIVPTATTPAEDVPSLTPSSLEEGLQVKLDLAKAYIDLNFDANLAVPLLEEIIAENNPQFTEKAEALLAQVVEQNKN